MHPLHPENMDATCSDVREHLAPTSFHVVKGENLGSVPRYPSQASPN